jgi:hypothetical protein
MMHRATLVAVLGVAWLPAILGPAASAQEAPPPLPELGGGLTGEGQGLDVPPLPSLEGEDELAVPPLPSLGDEEGVAVPPLPGQEPGVPALPELPQEAPAEAPEAPEGRTFSDYLDEELARLPFTLHGFLEMRAGPRITNDPNISSSFTMGETRLQLETHPSLEQVQLNLKADLLYDFVLGDGTIEFREANVAFSPFHFMDVKAGRQILTWGTGDLLFLNDLFPKDYVSFFIGRDIEYLKAPSDALKVSLFSDIANLDIVYTPQFDPDVYVTGERLSYFNPLAGTTVGEGMKLKANVPDDWFRDDEVAARLYRSLGSYEVAAYGYRGFWKSPQGINPITGRFTFPDLNAYGASVRGPAIKGIGNAEFAYYDSADDSSGNNPFIPNSQWRFLLGYAQDLPEVAQDLSVGVQYYVELMEDYGAYKSTLPPGSPQADQARHVMTLRLTKLLLNQDLRLELFSFFGLSDQDLYLRPYFSYSITDRWRLDGGANILLGNDAYDPFGQFEDNSNVYMGLRYSF